MSKFVNPCKVITGPLTRWSYANVWDPKSINGGTPKFSICLLIPKTDIQTIDKINRAMAAAFEEGQNKLKGADGSVPHISELKLPLRDGDAEHPGDPTYAEQYFINAFSGPRYTPAFTAGPASRCTPTTTTETVESPAR